MYNKVFKVHPLGHISLPWDPLNVTIHLNCCVASLLCLSWCFLLCHQATGLSWPYHCFLFLGHWAVSSLLLCPSWPHMFCPGLWATSCLIGMTFLAATWQSVQETFFISCVINLCYLSEFVMQIRLILPVPCSLMEHITASTCSVTAVVYSLSWWDSN